MNYYSSMCMLFKKYIKRFTDKCMGTTSRRTIILTFAALIGSVGLFITAWLHLDKPDYHWGRKLIPGLTKSNKPIVTLAVVACENRVEEAMTMLKSAVIFSKNINLHVIAVTDNGTQEELATKMKQLKGDAESKGISINYKMYPSWFPKEKSEMWTQLFKPCSSQRLFFPWMFKHVDSLIYVDSDTYFLSDVGHLWRYFQEMNSTQLAAMSAEHELPGDGFYNKREKQIPYYGPRGVNSGVMLMNLTRMRQKNLDETYNTVLEEYKDKLIVGDQDILNIVFHFSPEYLYVLKCEYNFRAQHCKCDFPGLSCACNSAADNGVAIIHGNRKRFQHFSNSPEFVRDFYNHFHAYELRSNNLTELYANLKASYNRVEEQPCGMTGQVLLSQFEAYLQSSVKHNVTFNYKT